MAQQDDALELVRLRNNFYRDTYRKAMIILLISLLLNVGLVLGIGYMYTQQPKPVYFATNQDGTLKQLIPLGEPYVDDTQLLSWATQAAIAANSFNFLDYRNNLQQARKYFTSNGFDNYIKALQSSGNLKNVTERRLVVKGIVTDIPVVLTEGLMQDRYAWKVQVPMIVRYVSASAEIKQPIMVTLLIVRVSTLDTDRGIAIESFVSQDRTNES